MSYDQSCYDLAESFIDDDPNVPHTDGDKRELAQLIQDIIEEFLNERSTNNSLGGFLGSGGGDFINR